MENLFLLLDLFEEFEERNGKLGGIVLLLLLIVVFLAGLMLFMAGFSIMMCSGVEIINRIFF